MSVAYLAFVWGLAGQGLKLALYSNRSTKASQCVQQQSKMVSSIL